MEQEKRTLVRPKIGLAKALLKTACVLLADGLITLAICCLVNYCFCKLSLTAWIIMSISIFTVILTVVIVCRIKQIAIYLILMYQKFAPSSVRLRCVYNPSCSEYMKLSIEKYGFIEGVKKGWDRLNRCHYPNSGDDYP